MDGWIIDKDYLYNPEYDGPRNRVGVGQTSREQVEGEAMQFFARSITIDEGLSVSDLDDPVRFRLMDEDDEVHFGGAISRSWLDGEEFLAFAPLEFGTADTGATIMEYRGESGEWVML